MIETRWQSYPRPQMRREGYAILNGIWKLNEQEICVPFAPKSRLSGYKGTIEDYMTYEMQFTIPKDFHKPGILLHFGAVDQEAKVYVNDVFVGEHKGGYLPFYFHIEDVVKWEDENTLKVEVTDRLGTKYPYGKQCKKRGGMWYTEISGIWQTVWLENVPKQYIENLKITPDLEQVEITVYRKDIQQSGLIYENTQGTEKSECINSKTTDNAQGFTAIVRDGDGVAHEYSFNENTGVIKFDHPIHWTVDHPYLDDIQIKTAEDEVASYFALRTIEIQEVNGIQRVCLNNKPIFMHGVLDQGYYEDGIFLPAHEKEFERANQKQKRVR